MSYIEEADDFIRNEKPFHLGFLPTEQSNPLTRELDREFARSGADGVRNLQRVDREVSKMAKQVFASPEFAALCAAVEATVRGGHRVIFSGCGATGRLSILLESMWKKACRANLAPYADRVESIMTGGDYALVKSVESFEDYAAFGARQVRDRNFASADLLIAITEGGETSSVLGTVAEATRLGAKAFLLFNNPATLLAEHLERSREAIENPRVTVLDLSCGPMALAGSTRMQATTSEQLIASAALEVALRKLLKQDARIDFAAGFARLLDQLESGAAVKGMAEYIDFEAEIYRGGGRVTYFADDFMLDIFTDTTERSPTFMLPPFRKLDDTVSPQPWALARNPLADCAGTMSRAVGHEPRCIEWTLDDYRAMNAPAKVLANPPAISCAELYKFPLGNEPLPERFATGRDAAVLFAWQRPAPELEAAYQVAARGAAHRRTLAVGSGAIELAVEPTLLRLWEHLAIKLVLNTISTGTMVRLGRVAGNWMSFVAVSNKKLIDRAIRLVSELSSLPYREAAHELFRSIEEIAAMPPECERPSTVQHTLKRLGKL